MGSNGNLPPNLDNILAQINNRLLVEPNNVRLLVDKARMLSFLNKLDEALDILNKASQIDPSIKDTWYLMAEILNKMGRTEAAKIALQRANSSTTIPVQQTKKIIYQCPTCGGVVPPNSNRCPQCGLPIVNNINELPPGTVGIFRSALKKIVIDSTNEQGNFAMPETISVLPKEGGYIGVVATEENISRKVYKNTYGIPLKTKYNKKFFYFPFITMAIVAILVIVMKFLLK